MIETITTHNQQETEQLGAAFAEHLLPGDIVAFYGGLGAGKTAFIRGALKALGAEGHITSPTFNIVNEYALPDLTAAHFDLYRIENSDGLESVGFYDYLDRALLLIEWSEHIEDVLDELSDVIRIQIEGAGDGARTITIETPESRVQNGRSR